MFTGLIEEIGTLAGKIPSAGKTKMQISARQVLEGTKIGDSIAVNGVCLTVVEIDDRGFAVEAVEETVRHSTISIWTAGRKLNLERAMAVGDRLGGHMVQGHVDGMGRIISIASGSDGYRLRIEADKEVMRYVVHKGSITVDGISLTVARTEEIWFEAAIIPHTWQNTNLHTLKTGDRVNLETDVIAKYVEKFFRAKSAGGLSEDFLRTAGF